MNTLHRTSLRLALAAAVLLNAGCGMSFDVRVKSESTVKGGPFFLDLLPDAFADFMSMDLSQSSDFKNSGVAKDHVKSAKMTSFTLSAVSPTGATLDFIDDIAFFVESEGRPKKRVAQAASIAKGATTVSLDVDDVELAPYVSAPVMSITTDAKAGPPKKDTKIEARIVFEVEPRLF